VERRGLKCLVPRIVFAWRIGNFLLFACGAGAPFARANQAQEPQQQEKEKQSPENGIQEKQAPEKKDASVWTQMRNVNFRLAENISLRIRSLSGALTPVGEHRFPVMDDKNSFKIHVDTADILISPGDLANALNSYVFAKPKSPVGGVSISIQKGQLKIRGKLREKGHIPFETVGTLSTTPDGRVRLHGEKIKALHIPVKRLMDAFGVEIDDLIKNGKILGVVAEENDLILDLQQVLPPPHIDGAVTAIRIEDNAIATTFGKTPENNPIKPAASGNFMAYQGNRMQFGKLTMNDVDMQIIDMDPSDPLDFYLDRYKDQLAAGYTKISASFQLHVFMKDYGKLKRKAAQKKQSD
jgi:hypothetical protein